MSTYEEEYLISVILPVYNVGKFIGKCLASIISQSYTNMEIILVNDGSTDNSVEIINEYIDKDERIKLVNSENKGVSVARNIGLEKSQGDFIVFIDSDDYIAPDFMSYMLAIYKQTNADICLSMNNFSTKDKEQVKKDSINTISAEKGVAELLYPRIRMGVWNKLWKREFIEKNHFRFLEGQHTGEGLIFMTNAAQYANCIGVGRRKVYCYRLDNDESATTKANVEKHGIGSLNAMDIVEANLDMSSSIISNAMKYQRWSTSTYALRHIIDAGSQREYNELYSRLKKEIRKNSLKMLRPSVSLPLRMRCIAIARCLSPVGITKLSLHLRDRHLNKKE